MTGETITHLVQWADERSFAQDIGAMFTSAIMSLDHDRNTAINISPLAGKPAPHAMLVNVPRLITAYDVDVPDLSFPEQRISFGASAHRRSAFERSFNEWQCSPSRRSSAALDSSRVSMASISRHRHACTL
ncbi:phosphoglucomutase [Paraburkholderia hospita]|uniref:Phosphoglucomutase n=1 Tax=Paraburkholderia hospita TaxID=169430 RepID=A0ABN0F5H4_9BURK|nr:phosphoglucomutase [Paraburkholderia hospita]